MLEMTVVVKIARVKAVSNSFNVLMHTQMSQQPFMPSSLYNVDVLWQQDAQAWAVRLLQ